MMYFIACSSSFICISANKTNSEPGNGQVDPRPKTTRTHAGVPPPEPLRHVTPRRTCAEPPRNALHHLAMRQPRPTPTTHPRQKRLDHSPDIIRHLLTRHASDPRGRTPQIT